MEGRKHRPMLYEPDKLRRLLKYLTQPKGTRRQYYKAIYNQKDGMQCLDNSQEIEEWRKSSYRA